MRRNRRQGDDVRNRSPSPPVHSRDHRPTGRYQESYSSHRSDDTRVEEEERLRRSSLRTSPLELERSERMLVERRDYNSTRHFNGDRDERDGGSTRTPPSGQHYSTLIEHRLPKYRMLEPTDISGHSSPSLRRDGDRKYQMLEHTDFSGHSSPSLRRDGDRDFSITRVGKEKDFQGIGSFVDGRSSASVQKPVYLDDGTGHKTYFKLPMDSGSVLNSVKMNGNFMPSSSSGNLRIGSHKDEELRYSDQIHSTQIPTRDSLGNLKYRDQLHPNKIPTRESYGEMKPMLYPRDASHPASPFSQSKAFQSTSSGPAKGEFFGSYQHDLPLLSSGFGPNNGKYTDPLVHDGNSDGLYLDSARHPKNPIAYQRDPQSPLRGEHQDFSYAELERRKKHNPGYMSDELYHKMRPTTQGDYGDRELSRPSYMDPEGKRFDDIESSHRSQRESGLWDQRSLQGVRVSNSLGEVHDEDFLGARSNHLEFEEGAYSDRGITNVKADYSFERDAAPRSYRENPRSAPMSQSDVRADYSFERDAAPRTYRENPRSAPMSQSDVRADYSFERDAAPRSYRENPRSAPMSQSDVRADYSFERDAAPRTYRENPRSAPMSQSDLRADYSFERDAAPRTYKENPRSAPMSQSDVRADYSFEGDAAPRSYRENPRSAPMSQSDVRADYSFEGDAAPRSYRENPRIVHMSQRELNAYRLDLSPQQRSSEEEMDIYDSSERLITRKYTMDDEVIRHNPGSTSSGRNISRQVELSGNGEHRRDGNESGLPRLPLSKRLNFGGRQKRNAGELHDRLTAYRASASDDCFSSQDLSVYEQQYAAKPRVSIKKRLRLAPSSNHNRLERDFHKPYKFRKRNWDDRYDIANAHDIEPVDDYVAPVKFDVPEDSEEFKNMVDKAFLQFYKQLNENPAHRRKCKEQGAAGTLPCSVCGSSKEFVDTQSLATHAAMSLKVGLRAEHLGLHRALCVLMGWNSTIASDHAWFCKALPDAEALAVKEDLVLWPPLVIIHNISIGNKNPDERKVVSIEEMEAILRGLGFGGGKTKVCRGKPANQSIMVVRFMPTFSGFQEAERLHNYYMENRRGRKEFPQMLNSINDESREEGELVVVGQPQPQESVDHVLYGYIGIAEDLDKLEFETKGRCVVRSKKDIMAIADAPLETG